MLAELGPNRAEREYAIVPSEYTGVPLQVADHIAQFHRRMR